MERKVTKMSATKQGWNQKIVRLREEYRTLCTFIDFFAKETGRDSIKIYEELVNFSLDYIAYNGFHYIITEEFTGRREPKGLLLSSDTQKRFKVDFNNYKNLCMRMHGKKLTVGEFTELLIFIYCMNNFEERHKKYVGYMKWGFMDTKLKK
ncbi:hypothetical protein [Clostridium sulfidigenes]|uniref:hypothetical protein n=1 Tax=Clostridium sulfidigenes TaxID=318464 RepID=UPI003F88998C